MEAMTSSFTSIYRLSIVELRKLKERRNLKCLSQLKKICAKLEAGCSRRCNSMWLRLAIVDVVVVLVLVAMLVIVETNVKRNSALLY